jgi:hypothetical protein
MDIKLRRADDPTPEKNELPRGIHAVIVNDQIFFVRRLAGRFVPLSEEEQTKLKKKHVK